MQMAVRNTSGKRQRQASALYAPIDGTGGDDLEVLALAVRADGRDELVADVLEELAQEPLPMADASLRGEQRRPLALSQE